MWEHHADRFPDAVVQVQGDREFTWREFDRRADGIAATLLAAGVAHQDKVAQYLYNAPEYLESTFGLYKAALVPVNTNYRYTDDEIVYLWDNADAVAVVFHGTFADRCERLKERLPAIRTWIWVDDGTAPCPDWAIDYEVAAASATERTIPPWGRSPDDIYMLYTGGTTGMPKGVMWRVDDVIGSLDAASRQPLPAAPGWDALDARITKPGPRNLPAAPLMHGTGAFNAMWNLALAGAVVTMAGRSFDPIELLDTVQTHRVNSMSIVGDAFARPILRALDAEPDRWDFSSMRVIVSSGVMWSSETKAGLLRHNPRLIMIDSLGSSEAIGMANNTTTSEGAGETAKFVLTAHCRVLTEDGHEVTPGSGERGRVALRGRTPIGYYKDPEKSASTFVTFEGVRWSIPGDYAEVEADGTVKLLGRGSQCINTGGEKVYPEEVEEALKLHPSVADAAVVGLPDERFGESITALVEAADGADIDEAALILHVRSTLAAYKAPKRVFTIDTIGRAANGKLDYRRLKALAVESAAAPPHPA
ncbi:MAG: fatty-acid--CoA ligase [Acidimicrobiales bacterium]|nr:fatty-acid--CoA ligase [Acidimicrobiales bacterium]